MIDLAALTQALERSKPMDFASDLADKQLGFNLLRDAGRLVSRLWQPCQTCDGSGTKVTEITRSPLGSGLPSSMYVIIDEIREECSSCGGGRVEPTPLLHDLTHKLMSDIADPSKTVRVDEFALELWRVANEETD